MENYVSSILQKEAIKKCCKRFHYVRGSKSRQLLCQRSWLYLLSKFHKLLLFNAKMKFENNTWSPMKTLHWATHPSNPKYCTTSPPEVSTLTICKQWPTMDGDFFGGKFFYFRKQSARRTWTLCFSRVKCEISTKKICHFFENSKIVLSKRNTIHS